MIPWARMKCLLAAGFILTVFAIEACSSARSGARHVPMPPTPAMPSAGVLAPVPPVAETFPVAPPATRPAVPAGPPRTLDLANGMELVSDSDLEGSLERWADGKDINLDHVIKRTSVYLDVAAKVKWDDNKKRERNAADHDRIVRESVEKAEILVAAARAGQTDRISSLSDVLLQRCVDCHTAYK